MATSKKVKSIRKKRRRLLILGTFSLATIAFTTYTMGKYWVQIYEKKNEKNELTVQLKKLKKKESSLRADANKMQDKEYIARYAREKYLYSKDGEFILRIP